MKTSQSLPLVSVCIPTYNGENYIKETIECAINQTYRNIEIIITDDQSNDKTIEICSSFSLIDNRIKIYQNKKNLGLVGNWCEVINKTSKESEWIKYLFQDDLMDSTTVEKMVNSALTSNVDFVLANREYIFEKNVSSRIKKNYAGVPKTGEIFKKSKKYSPNETATLIHNHIIFHNCLGEPPCILFKKSKYAHSDYPTEFIQKIDYVFILEKILDADFYFINEKLIKFRVHNSSQSFKNNIDESISTEDIYKRIFIHYYETIKICHLILNNDKYKRVRNFIGRNKIQDLYTFLIHKAFYKNKKYLKIITEFFNNSELKKDVNISKVKKVSFIKYELLKYKTKQLRNSHKL